MYKTAETVSPGHPDKIADLISDYVLTEALSNNSNCLLYTSPSPRDKRQSRMPSSA